MFEYSALLVFAQAYQNNANMKVFYSGTKGQKGLISQILDYSSNSSAVSANLCSILKLTIRFQYLHTLFQHLLLLSLSDSLLSTYLVSRALLSYNNSSKPFLDTLQEVPKQTIITYKATSLTCSYYLLCFHLRRLRQSIILLSYLLRHLS